MAKSMRSKIKRSFRSKKRESGVYAVAEAARLQRLSLKLHEKTMKKDQDGDVELDAAEETAGDPAFNVSPPESRTSDRDSMHVDTQSLPKRISTHGPRCSRREEWRKSKGMPARKGMNRQGGIAARRKAGRSQRRR